MHSLAQVKADIARIETGTTDYFPGLTSAQKKDKLSRMSYFDYLTKVIKADPRAVAYYQKITHDEWGVGIDAEPAEDAEGRLLGQGGKPRQRGIELRGRG